MSSTPTATDLYVVLATGIGRAITYLARLDARNSGVIPDLVDDETDPNPMTKTLTAYDLGRMLSPGFARQPTVLPSGAEAALAGLIRVAELTSAHPEDPERKQRRLDWIDAELAAVGSSLEQARAALTPSRHRLRSFISR